MVASSSSAALLLVVLAVLVVGGARGAADLGVMVDECVCAAMLLLLCWRCRPRARAERSISFFSE